MTGKRYIAALDQGTSSSRTLIFDENGAIVGSAQQEIHCRFPQNGWVELSGEEIWESQRATFVAALAQAHLRLSDLAAVGITNQRETTLLWDRATGALLAPAIVWQCRRSSGYVAELKERGLTETIHEKTGLIPDCYFSATKLAWLLDTIPQARERAARGELAFGTVDSWLIYKLTGGRVHATDASNASRTMLLDVHTATWDLELCKLWDIDVSLLPEVRSSIGGFGAVDVAALGFESEEAAFTGPPITGVLGDQQAALFGHGCREAGQAKNTYGTGCFLLLNTGGTPVLSQQGLLTTIAYSDDSGIRYALEGSVFNGGSVVKWLRDLMQIIDEPAQTEEAAYRARSNGGVYFVPAFTGLGAPYWNAEARGLVTGLTQATTRDEFIRAALESLAYQSADLVAAAIKDCPGVPLKELSVDGGASANNFLMQFQADLLNIPLIRPVLLEITAFGAAYAAGCGAGVWTVGDLDRLRGSHEVFEAHMTRIEAAELMAAWHTAVERTLL